MCKSRILSVTFKGERRSGGNKNARETLFTLIIIVLCAFCTFFYIFCNTFDLSFNFCSFASLFILSESDR